MAIALAVLKIDRTRRKLRITFGLTFSGNYVTGGDTLDFTAATDPSFLGYRKPALVPETMVPGGNPGGFNPEAVKGTTNANSKYKLFQSGSGSAAAAELAQAGYPAAITGDLNCTVEVEFGRGAN